MRNRQGITIAALIIAIIGLSVGFAAFSNTLTIRSTATVTPNASTMRVVFSKSSSGEVTGAANSINPDTTYSQYGDGGTIDNSTQGNSILKDLHAKFTAPGQKVVYSTNLYVYNAGSLQAQLTGVTFNNVTGESSYRKCAVATKDSSNNDIAPANQATASLVTAACSGITISVKVGNAKAIPSSTSLNNQILNVGASLPVEVTIAYENGSAYVDGPMEVTFGNIVINATSAVDASLVPTNPWKLEGLTSPTVTFDQYYSLNSGEDTQFCPQSFKVYSNGILYNGTGEVTVSQFKSSVTQVIFEPDYLLWEQAVSPEVNMYFLFDMSTSGSGTFAMASPSTQGVEFTKYAILSHPSIVCHYTVAQS